LFGETVMTAQSIIRVATTGLTLDEDDVIRLVTDAGDGFGEPRKQQQDSINLGIRNGCLTPERALEAYGYEVGAESLG
jgi:N-methylhydantoinase B